MCESGHACVEIGEIKTEPNYEYALKRVSVTMTSPNIGKSKALNQNGSKERPT